MNIRYLIDLLEQYEHDSDQREETEVIVTVHCMEHNGAGFTIDAKIDDVSIGFGNGEKDAVAIDIVLNEKDIDDLQRLKTTWIESE